ncbi:MAG TPA: hypothetical protein VGU63_10305 [Candidatus Acidoferrales bacterium]|nr:hypothetical protein [Candidatus Acidoferrales bacterium]
MNAHKFRTLPLLGFGAVSLLLGSAFGCNFDSTAKNSVEHPAKAVASAVAASESDNPGINLQCAAEHIQKAPAPFHWSFKKVVAPDTNADWEADVTPDAIAGTLIDNSGTRAIHGSRSDQTSWNTATLILSGPLPASTFSLVDNSSATTRAGTQTVNAVNAIKYTVDSSQDTPAEASLIRNVLGPDGFIKGAAWVTRDGCPVKFTIDVEQHNNNGTVEKEHYELNVTQH